MQYGPSAGLVNIRNWLSELQTQVHKRQPGNWAVSLGSGSQDLMSKVSDNTGGAEEMGYWPWAGLAPCRGASTLPCKLLWRVQSCRRRRR
jgi:hypothetical protein